MYQAMRRTSNQFNHFDAGDMICQCIARLGKLELASTQMPQLPTSRHLSTTIALLWIPFARKTVRWHVVMDKGRHMQSECCRRDLEA
jgi:hypothetical protein